MTANLRVVSSSEYTNEGNTLVLRGTRDNAAPNGMHDDCRVALINMPFATVARPSIQCGLLKSILCDAGYPTDVIYLNIRCADAIGPTVYSAIAEQRTRDFVGEWLFSEATFGERNDDEEYLNLCDRSDLPDELSRQQLLSLRKVTIPALLDRWVEETEWRQYRAIGFSCTFDQTLASLALARRLKERYPCLTNIFGGASFDRTNAIEYVKKLRWLDYVIVGEGDASLPALLEEISGRRKRTAIPGVIRRRNGEVYAEQEEMCDDLNGLPTPNYDEYFEAVNSVGQERLLGKVRPMLPFQSSRGCWWGSKHHCMFCGLNANGMQYRVRDPRKVFGELQQQSAKYRALSFVSTDNILDLKYISTLFHWISQERLDFRLFYETKANLTSHQLRALAQGGLRIMQPGIETLSTRCAQLMRKGTSLLLNVRVLKWAAYYGITVKWNLLSGVPGETAEDYLMQASVVDRLTHLAAPSGLSRICLDRHSPYYEARDTYYPDCVPTRAYSYIYPAEWIDIERVAFYYDTGVTVSKFENERQRLCAAIERWRGLRKRTPPPTLVYESGSDWIRIVDRRDPDHIRKEYFEGPAAAAYVMCSDSPCGKESVLRSLRESWHVTESSVSTMLNGFAEQGLMLTENSSYLSLALPANPEW